MALTESGLHAYLDLHPDRRCCQRSQFGCHDGHAMVARNLIRRSRRRAHHGQLVISHDWRSRSRACSWVLINWRHCRTLIAGHVMSSTLLSETPSSCWRRFRGSIMTLWTVSCSARPDFVSTNCFLELLAKHNKVHTSQSYFKNSNCFSFLN